FETKIICIIWDYLFPFKSSLFAEILRSPNILSDSVCKASVLLRTPIFRFLKKASVFASQGLSDFNDFLWMIDFNSGCSVNSLSKRLTSVLVFLSLRSIVGEVTDKIKRINSTFNK